MPSTDSPYKFAGIFQNSFFFSNKIDNDRFYNEINKDNNDNNYNNNNNKSKQINTLVNPTLFIETWGLPG